MQRPPRNHTPFLSLLAALLVACGGGGSGPIPEPTTYSAYAVTDNALYRVVLSGPGDDERVATLNTSSVITDLAWDGSDLYAVTFSTLVRIETETGEVTTVGDLGSFTMNALTADGDGTLYAASGSGGLYTVDKTTGRASLIGSLGLPASGDLAFTPEGTLYATVTSSPFAETDTLATVDLTTGQATVIGEIGYPAVFGLDVQGGVLYGLTLGGELLTLDVTTGRATLVRETELDFTGME
ncbi:hypothetical protein V3W47_02715 [Deinococcus sp. YIM 134068]|uniref:hypothetical protein n=1 Tax=Deinococcus lichenicola TaxID=3118910 RepID=UPI002F9308F0